MASPDEAVTTRGQPPPATSEPPPPRRASRQQEAGQPPGVMTATLAPGDAADPGRLLARLSHQFRLLAGRAAIGGQTYRDAAATGHGIGADWQRRSQMRRQAFRVMFTRIPAAALRPGLTPEAAAGTAWVIASPETHLPAGAPGGLPP